MTFFIEYTFGEIPTLYLCEKENKYKYSTICKTMTFFPSSAITFCYSSTIIKADTEKKYA